MVQVFHPHDRRPSLLDVWMNDHFDISLIASNAGVDADIIHNMMASQPAQREDAEQVLAALSEYYQKDWSLETVHVVLRKSTPNKSEIAHIMQEIDAEYESAVQGMQGLAQGTSQHEFMTQKTENFARRFIALGEKEGDEVALQVLINWQEREVSNGQKTP